MKKVSPDWIACCILAWLVLGCYIPHVAPSVTTGDAGEFMTSAATLSIAHAPSYPLYSLLGRIFIEIIPWGSEAYRLNLFSAFCSSMTIVLFYLMARHMGLHIWGSFMLPLIFAFSTSFWMNSLVTEVFPLNTFFVCLLLLVLFKAFSTNEKGRSMKQFILFSFLFGLGLGNHHILVFLGPIFLFLWLKRRPEKKRLNSVGIFTLMGLLGFSVYLMLPIRSSKTPPLNWGQPTTINKLYRTITRKDYGSFKLALGETPKRNVSNSLKQLKRFIIQMGRECPWPIGAVAFFGLCWNFRKSELAFSGFFLFILSGPLFFLLSNLPFDAQSEGIMGRFFIMPVMALLVGLIPIIRKTSVWGSVGVFVFGFLVFGRGISEARTHRQQTLVLDYGRAMLRTLPPQSALFMDGGDDAFYSLAMLHYVEGRRPDLQLHDRGGLVFRNVYGDDFRRIGKENKKKRREEVERGYLKRMRLFYSTMDKEILSGVHLRRSGFLWEAGPTKEDRIAWPLLILRSLYPIKTHDYRTRALGAFLPFSKGLMLTEQGLYGEGLPYLNRAQWMGFDVGWLKNNLSYEYINMVYKALQVKKLGLAEKIIRQGLQFDSSQVQLQEYLGLVYERSNRIAEARAQYEKTAREFPESYNSHYNLAVLHWKRKEWSIVIKYLEETLLRNPHYEPAMKYLVQAKFNYNQSLRQ